ncbi:hypothetical protein [Streptomyces sp. NPDC092307]|uniref:hypothetical protein n=1 Tax=Streptomyces sp. NPDC092307 TaxID=3366013 RepID=UPI003820A53D
MQRFKKAIATVVVAAGLFAGAGVGTASAAPSPRATALVDIYALNLLNGNQIVLLQNVAIPVAAAACGVTVNVLSAGLNQGTAACPALSGVSQLAWAQYA